MKRLAFLMMLFLCFGPLCKKSLAQKSTKKINRLIHKQLVKQWPNQDIKQTLIDTNLDPVCALFFEGNELFRLDNTDNTVGFLLLRRGFGCKIGGCGSSSDQGEGQICSSDGNAYEYFDYVILLDVDLTILKVSVVDYPGDYGYEITSKGWLKQFNGYKGRQLKYGKDIDAISGATISANSITSDIMSVHGIMTYFIIEKSLVAMK